MLKGIIWCRLRCGLGIVVCTVALVGGIAFAQRRQIVRFAHPRLERWLSQRLGQPVRIGALSGGLRSGLILSDVRVGEGFNEESVNQGWSVFIPRISATPGLWEWLWIGPHAVFHVRLKSPVVRLPRSEDGGASVAWGMPPSVPGGIRLQIADGRIIGAKGEARPVARDLSGTVEWRRRRLVVKRLRGVVADATIAVNGEYDGATGRWGGGGELAGTTTAVTARWDLSGSEAAGRLTGRIAFADVALAVHGELDLPGRKARFWLRRSSDAESVGGGGTAHVVVWMPSMERAAVSGQFRDMRFGEHRLSGRVLMAAIQKAGQSTINGGVLGHRLFIDDTPIAPVRGRWRWTPDGWVVRRLAIGRQFRLQGDVQSEPPYELRATAALDRIRLSDLAGMSRLRLKDEAIGTLSGTLSVDGKLPSPWVRGALRSADGSVGPMRYQSAHLQFEGPWPTVQFHDATLVSASGGTLRIEGNIDLRDLGTPTVFRQVDLVTAQGSTVWQGWDMAQHAGTADQLLISRQKGEGLAIGFRAFINAEPQGDERQGSDEVQVRYQLSEHQNVKVGVTKEEEFMGVEHRWQF